MRGISEIHLNDGNETPVAILLLLKRVDCNDGVASYIESLITGLNEVGDAVIIVSGEVTMLYGSETRYSAIKAAARDWIVIDGLSDDLLNWKQIQRITSIVKTHSIDVISPQGFASLPLGYLVGKICRRPVVTNYHPSMHGVDASSMATDLSFRQKLSYRAVNAMFPSDRYVALSSEIEEFFRSRCGIGKRRIHKQMLGVETDFYRAPSEEERSEARSRFGVNPSTLVCVLPGRMNVSKGHDIVAAATRILRNKRLDIEVVCLFPGGGDQREAIENDVIKEPNDRETFRFLGYVDREVLRDSYWAADLVLLPSRLEGFGLVVAEAMCCGAVAIRTPSGGWQDQIIEGETGYVVPFNDPVALAEAIERFYDSPLRGEMRRSAMRLASSSFAKSHMISGTSNLYRQASRRTVLPGMQVKL
jgi:glycosyltransferase involved in cell wall biosynthesis